VRQPHWAADGLVPGSLPVYPRILPVGLEIPAVSALTAQRAKQIHGVDGVAATLALVAGYQQGLPWMSKGGDTPLAAKIALWGGREIVGLLIVSLLAGTATIPYIAYHFHRISPYGVVANLIAMPIVSAWIMPIGILGLMSMPLGLDSWCWWLMGAGIEWMMLVAAWVTSFQERSGAWLPSARVLCSCARAGSLCSASCGRRCVSSGA